MLDTLFVSDDSKKLVGTVDLRNVLINNDSVVLADIANKNFISVEPQVDQEEVASMFRKYDLTVLPVVNKKQIILGIITVDDVMDVMVEEQTEDILKMGGVGKEETLNSTFSESVRLRLPWLVINLFTAFLAAFTVKAFEGTIEKVVRKEIFLGLINGLAIGIITGVIVGIMYHSVFLGIIILLAMIGNLVVAGVFGLLVPLILQKLDADPALSSSIFLTTATDVLGFFIFLSLANVFISKLV